MGAKPAGTVEIQDAEGRKNMVYWVTAVIWSIAFIMTMIFGADRLSEGLAMLTVIMYNICFALGLWG